MKISSNITASSNHNTMKLLVNRTDIINAFAVKTGLDPSEITIDIVTEPLAPGFPTLRSIHNQDVRIALKAIFEEGYNIAREYRTGNATIPNKISLIRAVRTLTHDTSLKDAKDFVEKKLLNE